MTANRSVPSALLGRVRSCAAAAAASAATTDRTATNDLYVRMVILESRNRVEHVVDNQITLRAQKNQMFADDSVLQIFRQRRQCLQNVGRHGRERDILGILAVYFERDLRGLRRVLFDDRFVLDSVWSLGHRRPD